MSKKHMSNHSYWFACDGWQRVMRATIDGIAYRALNSCTAKPYHILSCNGWCPHENRWRQGELMGCFRTTCRTFIQLGLIIWSKKVLKPIQYPLWGFLHSFSQLLVFLRALRNLLNSQFDESLVPDFLC